jgi:hypothetical protein
MTVRRGDLFAVGPHRVMCGDLEQGDALTFLSHVPTTPTLAWTDPPYDVRVARNFRRSAGLDDEPQLDRLLAAVVAALAEVRGPVYVEMGRNGVDLTRAALKGHAPPPLSVWEFDHLTYEKGRTPMWVFAATWHSGAELVRPEGDGWGPARDVLGRYAREVVLDPCMGKAGFGKIALDAGHTYYGMELQPGRVEVALRSLSRRAKAPVEPLGNVITHTEEK